MDPQPGRPSVCYSCGIPLGYFSPSLKSNGERDTGLRVCGTVTCLGAAYCNTCYPLHRCVNTTLVNLPIHVS